MQDNPYPPPTKKKKKKDNNKQHNKKQTQKNKKIGVFDWQEKDKAGVHLLGVAFYHFKLHLNIVYLNLFMSFSVILFFAILPKIA